MICASPHFRVVSNVCVRTISSTGYAYTMSLLYGCTYYMAVLLASFGIPFAVWSRYLCQRLCNWLLR